MNVVEDDAAFLRRLAHDIPIYRESVRERLEAIAAALQALEHHHRLREQIATIESAADSFHARMVAAESRASKAEAEAATLREALERVEIELEAAKAFGGGWFGNVKESVRNHYRVDARRARTQQHGAKE
jgi:chromosome segregation ATPase